MTSRNHSQVFLALCSISYLGRNLLGPLQRITPTLFKTLSEALDDYDPLNGDWEIVWGPALFRFRFSLYVANQMFVVRRRSNPSEYVVVIRGTSTRSLMTWFYENFWIDSLVPWESSSSAAPAGCMVSKAIAVGLGPTIHMRPRLNVPGAGLSVAEFLREVLIRNKHGVSLTVTGHSLGGALATALSLWLHDTQRSGAIRNGQGWDPTGKTVLSTYTFASPTLGNAAFARYADESIGSTMTRTWNARDLIAHAWDPELLLKAPYLYGPELYGGVWLEVLSEKLSEMARQSGFRHVRPDAPPLDTPIDPRFHRYMSQMFYHHTNGYVDALGLTGRIDLSRLILDIPWIVGPRKT